MRTYTDEQLVAYADGELTPDEARAIAAAAQADGQLARRIAQFTESRRLLADTFARHLQEPVPQRLLDVLREDGEPKVVPLRPRQPAARPHRSNWMPMALAASVTFVALGVGLLAGRGWERIGTAPLTVAGMPQDAAALRHALQTLASGEVLSGESSGTHYEVVPTASLRLPSGEYCREFESSVATQAGTQRARGLACRGAEGVWDMRTLASIAADAPSGAGENYQPAAGGGTDWAGTQDAHRLTPAEEQALIGRGWDRQR